MSFNARESFLAKLQLHSPKLLRNPKVLKLIQVYQDLERTLRVLQRQHKKVRKQVSVGDTINVHKLIHQLSRSKKKLERKIGNTILLEKQQLKRRIKTITQELVQRAG